MKPTIAITIGDFNGVGPEIALKAAAQASVRKLCIPLLVGPKNVFEHVAGKLNIRVKLAKAVFPWGNAATIPVLDVGDGLWADIRYGETSKAAGKSAGLAIEKAVDLCTTGKAAAMVTAPVFAIVTSLLRVFAAGVSPAPWPTRIAPAALMSTSEAMFVVFVPAKTWPAVMVTLS